MPHSLYRVNYLGWFTVIDLRFAYHKFFLEKVIKLHWTVASTMNSRKAMMMSFTWNVATEIIKSYEPPTRYFLILTITCCVKVCLVALFTHSYLNIPDNEEFRYPTRLSLRVELRRRNERKIILSRFFFFTFSQPAHAQCFAKLKTKNHRTVSR